MLLTFSLVPTALSVLTGLLTITLLILIYARAKALRKLPREVACVGTKPGIISMIAANVTSANNFHQLLHQAYYEASPFQNYLLDSG